DGIGFTYGGFYMSRGAAGEKLAVERTFLPAFHNDDVFYGLLYRSTLPHPSIVVRRSCYEMIGPFRDELLRSQDYDMALRLSRRYHGQRIAMPTYHYRQHAGPRGGQAAFSTVRNEGLWYHYDKMIFSELD